MKPLLWPVLMLAVASGLAQSASVTSQSASYSAGGGTITFTVSLAYPADATAVSFSVRPPAAEWGFVSTGGTDVPEVRPQLGDTIDPTRADSVFGWAYAAMESIPSATASFSFVLSYPAGLMGDQSFTFRADYRSPGQSGAVPITVAPMVLGAAPSAPMIAIQPVNATVTAGQNATFTVGVVGVPAPTIKWQSSTNGGVTWSDIVNDATYAGATTPTLTVGAVTLAMHGSRFRASTTNTQGSAASNGNATLSVIQAPIITQQPRGQMIVTGAGATFAVAATGSGSLTYQWYFTPANGTTPQSITGATASSHTITNAQAANAGDYVCVVSNGVSPNATSNAAPLTVAARIVRIPDQTAAPGSNIAMAVQLLASGAENTVSFSLNFDPTKLIYVTSALGADAADATLTLTVTAKDSGNISFLIGKGTGTTFTAGTRTILTITFAVNASVADGATLGLTFGDTPSLRRIAGVNNDALEGAFADGAVMVSSGYEGDVTGNGEVDAADWVKMGRIVVGLDPAPTGSTFMKSDVAPRASKGDAVVDAGDWVQLGRYVVGLDAPQPAGGPSVAAP